MGNWVAQKIWIEATDDAVPGNTWARELGSFGMPHGLHRAVIFADTQPGSDSTELRVGVVQHVFSPDVEGSGRRTSRREG
jgi:hypothetical protein